MTYGFDCARDLSPFVPCLRTRYNFVGRYYNVNNPSKNLSFAEANYLSVSGLRIVAVWENGYPTSVGYFSKSKGISDGASAHSYAANTIHQPTLTPIYFVVDFNCTQGEIDGPITDYFRGISTVLAQLSEQSGAPSYLVGVYGSGLACSTLLNARLVTYSWLAQSSGWRGSASFTSYNIKQKGTITICPDAGSVAGDPNESPQNNEGSFKVGHLDQILSRR